MIHVGGFLGEASRTDSDRRRRCIRAEVAVAAIMALVGAQGASAGEYFHTRPFHPLLCDTAIAAAQRAGRFGADSDCDLRLLAEGLYCRALQGDLAALDASIVVFERVVERAPFDLYAHLELAGALQQRFRASPRATQALERALSLLPTATVGDAHAALSARMASNLDLLRAAARGAVAERQMHTAHGGDGTLDGEPLQQQASLAAVARFAPCAARQLATDGGGT